MSGFGRAGFMNGLSQGVDLGMKIVGVFKGAKESSEAEKIKGLMKDGIAESKAARDKAINDTLSLEMGAGDMGPPAWKVGDQSFGDEAAARAHAEKSVPKWEDFYMRDVVPKISEAYLSQGNVEMSEKWNSWATEKNTKKGMESWAKALRAGQMGDFNAYAKHMVEAYNTPGYFEDGVSADGYDLVKDGDGNVTGLTLKLRNEKTGETFTETINGQEDMVRMGVGLLEPAKAFEITMKNVDAARSAGIKAQEENAKFQRDIMRDDRKAEQSRILQSQKDSAALQRGLTMEQYKSANQKPTNKEREVQFIRQELAKSGLPAQQIDAKVQQYLGIKDDASLRQSILSDINRNDVTGAFRKLPEAEQRKQIDAMVNLVKNAQGGANQNGQQPGQAPRQTGRPMIYDSKTGKMVPYGQ